MPLWSTLEGEVLTVIEHHWAALGYSKIFYEALLDDQSAYICTCFPRACRRDHFSEGDVEPKFGASRPINVSHGVLF